MRNILLTTAMLGVALAASTASAQPGPPRGERRAAWDSRGWVELGNREVNGRVDRDRIEVGRYEGRFTKLTLVVENSDLELIDFKIVFGDRTEYHPQVQQVFREGQRTRVLELPPSENVIRFIDFQYKNLPGGGNARVAVWGFKAGDNGRPPGPPPAPEPPPPPPRPAFDPRGWTALGARTVNGRADHDRIAVGRYEGKFTKMALLVEDSDLELIDLSVQFKRGPAWHPATKHFFREGERSHVIDFPGDDGRTIRYIDIRYRNLPGGGRAKVKVFAKRDDDRPPPPAPPAFSWDSRGWKLLGERQVNGRVDNDRIEVGRYEGRFSRLTLVVLDSDLEMIDLAVKFHRGAPYHPEVKAFFRENTRTRVIDLPGNDDRVIQWIEFRYRNLPGGGSARVQVWAQ